MPLTIKLTLSLSAGYSARVTLMRKVLLRRNNDPALSDRWHIRATANIADGGSYSHNLHPFVIMHKLHLDIDADNAIGPQLVGLKLHAANRQLAGLVHQFRILFKFALKVAFDADQPVADGAHRVDTIAHHQPHRLEAFIDDQPELLSCQIGSEGAPPVTGPDVHCMTWFSH